MSIHVHQVSTDVGMKPSFRYLAEVLEVIDGDTVRLMIDLGFRTFTKVDIRLKGVWAPELSEGHKGAYAREYAQMMLGQWVTVETELNTKGNEVRSFTRYVGTVWNRDKRNVNEMLQLEFKSLKV